MKKLIPLTLLEAVGLHCQDCAKANQRQPADCQENGYCWLWPWRMGVEPGYDVLRAVWEDDDSDLN